MTVIIACGLAREGVIVASGRRGIVACVGGGDAARLEAALETAVEVARSAGESTPLLLSSGIAGGLDPALAVGAVVVDGDPAVVVWLRRCLPDAVIGRVAGSEAIAATKAAKRDLRALVGAVAVDLESHVARRAAARLGLRFGVVRVVSDAADHELPHAALLGMRDDGGVALIPVLASLARRPGQLPALIMTAARAARAMTALRRAHDALGAAGIGRLDDREFALEL